LTASWLIPAWTPTQPWTKPITKFRPPASNIWLRKWSAGPAAVRRNIRDARCVSLTSIWTSRQRNGTRVHGRFTTNTRQVQRACRGASGV